MGTQSIGTISSVIVDLHKAMKIAQPDLKHIVFSPTLDYVASIHALRRQLKVKEDLKNELVISGSMPLLAYNRNYLTISDILNERSRFRAKGNIVDANNDNKTYKVLYGSVLYRYLYITSSLKELEQFEQAFACNASFREILRFESNLGDEGTFEYQVYWDNLSDFFISEIEDGSVKCSVSGLAKIVGWWVVYPEVNVGRIEEINVDIDYPEDNNLIEFTVE
jgi:hypothetical protein